MAEIFITSDTHFNHGNIIRYCNRPFTSTEEMNEEMISKWNKRIKPNDHVYHLGDFVLYMPKHNGTLFSRLNGKIHLIYGNHDKIARKSIKNGDLMVQFAKDYHELTYEGTLVTMMHYPIASWNRKHHGSVNAHGHTHGNYLSPGLCQIDVGVDVWDYSPAHISEVIAAARLNETKRVDDIAPQNSGLPVNYRHPDFMTKWLYSTNKQQ
jgi:calcineurin-like phosphoesterase family protein